jgi:hypothetical protein
VLLLYLKKPRSHTQVQEYCIAADHNQDEYSGLSASLHLVHTAWVVVLQLRRYSLGLQTGFVSHCKQLIVLDAAVYFPSVHKAQSEAPASDAYVPGLQAIQLMDVDEPTDLLLDPSGHGTHTEDAEAPTADENVPATHDKQLEAPLVAEYVPAAHERQVDAREAPTVAEYFPGTQDTQSDVPFDSE